MSVSRQRGSGGESDGGGQSPDPNEVEWWRIRPRQAAPPRTTSISTSANPSGRFIANEEMLRNEVWAGAKTLPGQALKLPKVAPYGSYMVGLVTAAVYGTVVRVYDTQGADAAAELLEGLGLSRAAVLEQTELWRLLSGCFVHTDLGSLVVVLYGMLAVAPRVEASLGYRTFAAAYALSAVVAADVLIAGTSTGAASGGSGNAAATLTQAAAATATATAGSGGIHDALLDAVMLPGSQALALGDPGLLCGGLGAVMGLAGCSVAHQLINGDVEREASGAAASSSGGGGSSSSEGLGGGTAPAGSLGGVDAATAVLLAGAAAVALQHALEPGGAALAAALGAGFGTVTREVELPDGSMWIPDPDAVSEVTVVLDRTPSIQRSLATTAVTAVVLVATLVVAFGTR
ncbi:hypothetical protein PLESTM_000284800 [Pleodorina starrii]|nr:hypothetical protein PLESTM_000284800 [Pleodorina starrii]